MSEEFNNIHKERKKNTAQDFSTGIVIDIIDGKMFDH